MFRINTHRAMALAAVLGCASAAQAINFTVDPAAPWQGFMNVFELPANGGGYVFGSPWGTPDLTANFSGSTLTLGVNSVNDPNAFWYTPSGGPGSEGNKIMDANFYVEPAGSLPGQSVTFSGTVLTNTFTAAHTAIAFIKDFAPDYSSSVTTAIPLTPGAFSLTLDTINDPARHVQYGFQTVGKNVWITDIAPFGNVTLTASTPSLLGDFDSDGDIDALDIDQLFNATPGAVTPATTKFDVNADGNVNTTVGATGSDADFWVRNIKSSEYGDANLDARVNFDDLLALAQHYNQSGDPSWSLGNFNGDATINFDDLLLLAQHYNFGVSPIIDSQLGAAGGTSFMADLALARSMVPEPSSLAGIATLTLVSRRRRA